MSGERLKIAVFVDFDNIEIGAKTTLSRHFDIGAVLEALKERGEVVTKIAYGDWKRAADYSRTMTQHAVQMVQRNLTPGGDKNGADINLALDALEMALTHNHINAFVIVGGDSDFIALVEKLKLYDKTVFVVGGRSFTSAILQKNCHEFIAYENLIGAQPGARKSPGRTQIVALEKAVPMVRRALKVLADREVSPQLGLLKSTLLQLDSTFSERDHGASTFREFMEKMAKAGYVNLKQVDRSLLVEMKDLDTGAPAAPAPEEAAPPPEAPTVEAAVHGPNGIHAITRLFQIARTRPRWPMYLRNVKKFLRSVDPAFDERRYGFTGMHELLRQAQREGLLRVERNRQGVLRVFPGERFLQEAQPRAVHDPIVTAPVLVDPDAAEPVREAGSSAARAAALEILPEVAVETPKSILSEAVSPVPPADEKPKRRRRAATGAASARRKSSANPRTKSA